MGWSSLDRSFQEIDRGSRPTNQNLHRPIRKIAYAADEVQVDGCSTSEESEAHSLDSTVHDPSIGRLR